MLARMSVHGSVAHETLLFDLSAAGASARSGDWARARERVVEALGRAGWNVVDAEPFDAEAVAAAPPSWLVVIVANGEDTSSFYIVPEERIDAPMRAALVRCDGAILEVSTPSEDPELFAAWSRVAMVSGTREVEDLELALGEELPEREALEPLAASWDAYYVGGFNDKVDGTKLAAHLGNVTYVFEVL